MIFIYETNAVNGSLMSIKNKLRLFRYLPNTNGIVPPTCSYGSFVGQDIDGNSGILNDYRSLLFKARYNLLERSVYLIISSFFYKMDLANYFEWLHRFLLLRDFIRFGQVAVQAQSVLCGTEQQTAAIVNSKYRVFNGLVKCFLMANAITRYFLFAPRDIYE